MGEPRRPRVISSRPGTSSGGPHPPEPEQETPASKTRATSAKVTVAPVPVDDGAANGPIIGNRTGPASGRPNVTKIPADGPREGSQPKGDVPGASQKSGRQAAGGADAVGAGTKSTQSKQPETTRPGTQASGKRSGAVRNFLPGSRKGPGPASTSGSRSAGSGGAEAGARVLSFPEPAHRRRRRRAWLGAVGVVVVLAVVMALALFSPALAVRKVVFDGGKLVGDKTLQTAVEPLVGRPLPQVTQKDVDALLSKVTQIKSSRIEASPPSTLLVHVVERVPVALLKDGKSWIQVDQDGVPLGTVADQSKVKLPVIDGGPAAVGKATFRAITAVLATLPQSILGKLASASAQSPDAVQLSMLDGKTVVWGNASDMELKAQVLEALVTAPAPTAVEGKPAPPPVNVYDVSTPRHPVTR